MVHRSCFQIILLIFLMIETEIVASEKQIEINGKDTIVVTKEMSKNGGWWVYRELRDSLCGKSEHYYSNGKLSQTTNFKNGKENGIRQGFLPDGSQSAYKPYRNGTPIDTHKVWFKNKKQESIIIYDTSGNKNGWCRNWFETGVLKDSTLYAHGEKLEEHLFYTTGKPMFRSKLKPDGYIITSASFYTNGAQSGEVKNGNGRIIVPKHLDDTNSFDTLDIKEGKVTNAEFYFFHNQ